MQSLLGVRRRLSGRGVSEASREFRALARLARGLESESSGIAKGQMAKQIPTDSYYNTRFIYGRLVKLSLELVQDVQVVCAQVVYHGLGQEILDAHASAHKQPQFC